MSRCGCSRRGRPPRCRASPSPHENAAAIAGIAQRLDGLPLAIELAAARVKLLPPAAILARLEHSLGLLVSGRRDVPDRQRTLRATIAWSYELLSEAAKRLLAVCSVFRGGIDLAVLEAVCAAAVDLRVPVLDAADRAGRPQPAPAGWCGIRRRPRGSRCWRPSASSRPSSWRELPDQEQVRAAHASAFWDLAKDLARPPSCPDRAGLDPLELEHDNFRAALDWYAETEPGRALRLANRLTAFWSVRGHFSEGRRRLGDLLELVPDDDPERVDALSGAAWLATDQGDRAAAIALLEESIERARAGRDPVREAAGLFYRGRAKLIIGDPSGGRADIERALELQTEAGDDAGLAAALWFAGAAAHFDDDLGLAIERFERCVAAVRGARPARDRGPRPPAARRVPPRAR